MTVSDIRTADRPACVGRRGDGGRRWRRVPTWASVARGDQRPRKGLNRCGGRTPKR